MRKLPHIVLVIQVLILLVAGSCQRHDILSFEQNGEEIVIKIDDGIEMSNSTKTQAVVGVPGLIYWGMIKASNGSVVQSTTSASVPNNNPVISTGRYQTNPVTSYTFYGSNANFTTGGNMTVANNNTDIVVGNVTSSSFAPVLTLEHIFARIGSLTLIGPQDGSGNYIYGIESMHWSIKSKGSITGTAGTYRMSDGVWTASSSPLSSYTTLFDDATLTGSDVGKFNTAPGSSTPAVVTQSYVTDIYLIPGEYTIQIEFSMVLGGNTKTYTQTGDVTISRGKINNISATTYTDDSEEIVISCTLNAWGTANPSTNALND